MPPQAMPVDQALIDQTQAWPSPRSAWYAVFVLSVVLMFSALDRGIVALLTKPIKHDLKLSDTELSLLFNFSSVFFFIFIGFPLARLARSDQSQAAPGRRGRDLEPRHRRMRAGA